MYRFHQVGRQVIEIFTLSILVEKYLSTQYIVVLNDAYKLKILKYLESWIKASQKHILSRSRFRVIFIIYMTMNTYIKLNWFNILPTARSVRLLVSIPRYKGHIYREVGSAEARWQPSTKRHTAATPGLGEVSTRIWADSEC